MEHQKWDLLLKSRILAFFERKGKATGVSIDAFLAQLLDETLQSCTIPVKEAQQLFTYLRKEMRIYGLATLEELEDHFSRSEKRHKARIRKYQDADLLDKIKMEWKAARVFDLSRQEALQPPATNKVKADVPATGSGEKKSPRVSHLPSNRKPVKSANCY